MKKKGGTRDSAALCICQSEYLTAAVPCGAAASACGFAGAEFNVRVNFKSVSQKIDLYGLRLFIEVFLHNKLKTIYIEDLIVVLRLIQSHSQ